jgi:hypothetical protein
MVVRMNDTRQPRDAASVQLSYLVVRRVDDHGPVAPFPLGCQCGLSGRRWW